MSRQAVRSEITAELQAWAISAGVVFVQTINLANSTTAEAWCTVEFFSDFTQSECFDGSDRVESGTFDVTIFVKAGTGDAAAVDLCDHLQDHLWLGHLPSNLEITKSQALRGYKFLYKCEQQYQASFYLLILKKSL